MGQMRLNDVVAEIVGGVIRGPVAPALKRLTYQPPSLPAPPTDASTPSENT
jgi:hypothetical protein